MLIRATKTGTANDGSPRTTATPDAIQTKIDQDMGLSPPLMNERKVSGLTGN